jgi:hypothetical protein
MKYSRSAVSCFTVLFLLTSQLAFGQTPKQAKPLGHYQTLFALSNNIARQTKEVCKTETCNKASDELAAVLADGQEKHKKEWLVQETRKQFHADYDASMKKLRAALIDGLPESTKKAIASRQLMDRMQVKPVQGTSEECLMCKEVLLQTSAICMIYELWCPICTLICMSTAAIAFGHCQLQYCEDPVYSGGGPNCPPALIGCS